MRRSRKRAKQLRAYLESRRMVGRQRKIFIERWVFLRDAKILNPRWGKDPAEFLKNIYPVLRRRAGEIARAKKSTHPPAP